jgi:hypothetical protein
MGDMGCIPAGEVNGMRMTWALMGRTESAMLERPEKMNNRASLSEMAER